MKTINRHSLVINPLRSPLAILALFLLLATAVAAQPAEEEIRANPLLSASNYVAYIDPDQPLSPAPKGYEPFYISHYGRHGSRWLTSDWQYTDVLKVLRKADRLQKLTPLGTKLLADLEAFHRTAEQRIGDLTPLGERQHHKIGRRMTEHFPEVFRGSAQVDARSSFVVRCILSMVAECEELTAFNPKLSIHNDVGQCFQYYLHGYGVKNDSLKALSDRAEPVKERYQQQLVHPQRLCSTLFNDADWVAASLDAVTFMVRLFDVAANMQSHDDGLDLYPLFTHDEIYAIWKWRNISHYLQYANATLTDNKMTFTQLDLLRNIITTADTLIAKAHFNGATLRFGHEVDLLPLACILGLGNCDTVVDDLDRLDQVWANYRIFPMAGNVQLVFFRPTEKSLKKNPNQPILVKALLNEREIALPVAPYQYPYCRWDDLRAYYIEKYNLCLPRK